MTLQTLKSEIERETGTLYNLRITVFDSRFDRNDFFLLIREAMTIGAQLGIKGAQREMSDALAELARKDRN